VTAAVVGQDAQAVVGHQARLAPVVPDLVAFLIDVGFGQLPQTGRPGCQLQMAPTSVG
jgi:hypothetical protein